MGVFQCVSPVAVLGPSRWFWGCKPVRAVSRRRRPDFSSVSSAVVTPEEMERKSFLFRYRGSFSRRLSPDVTDSNSPGVKPGRPRGRQLPKRGSKTHFHQQNLEESRRTLQKAGGVFLERVQSRSRDLPVPFYLFYFLSRDACGIFCHLVFRWSGWTEPDRTRHQNCWSWKDSMWLL